MTVQDIIKDAREVSYGDRKDTKRIAEQYGVEATKKDDLIKALREKALDIIRTKEVYDFDDWSVFNSYWDVPATAQKIRKAFNTMPINFAHYGLGIAKANIKNPRGDWYRRRYSVMIETLEKMIYEHNNADQIKAEEDLMKKVVARLMNLTDKFRLMNLQRVIEVAKQRYNNYKGLVYEDLNRGMKIGYNEVKLNSDNFRSCTLYLEHSIKEFNSAFDNNLKAVADRLIRNGLKDNNIKLVEVNHDPKFLEMVLESNNEKFYCRSIFAAENSNLVSAHWRFIITKQNA